MVSWALVRPLEPRLLPVLRGGAVQLSKLLFEVGGVSVIELSRVNDLDINALGDAIHHVLRDSIHHDAALMPEATAQADHEDRAVELYKGDFTCDADFEGLGVGAEQGAKLLHTLCQDLLRVFLVEDACL
eukprot:CAMPEP_0174717886 /NCGR_PEP_ID=MMETSP1094-20130205/27465_1 /TAXON_ID=156173 /ORGANISM="Chrysochromulina brevifilum, Strain UTEX LB 985" /LENGTH=129 /DNA_ID=CAMNT_0015917889 /DNA_START=428 /DNA_END=818 /DNA_ORIENTATION=-